MTFLTPIYLLGGLAIALPILAHLIRRTPKRELPFSSLMFLEEAPPQLTRRSRLDQWPLLLLRCLALLLLAFAFARPFFRTSESVLQESQAKRWVMLIDTSASMRRSGLWDAAVERATQVLETIPDGDRVVLASFDSEPTVLIGDEAQNDTTSQIARVKQKLAGLQPSWMPTDLAASLRLDYLESKSEKSESQPTHVVLISDAPIKGNAQSLSAYQWPDGYSVQLEAIRPTSSTNASLRWVQQQDTSRRKDRGDANGTTGSSGSSASASDDGGRLLITNSDDATVEEFQIQWDRNGSAAESRPVTNSGSKFGSVKVRVPAGRSRLIRVPDAAVDANRFSIVGDVDEFDNVCFRSPLQATEHQIWFVDEEKNVNAKTEIAKSTDPFFFLSKVPFGDRYRRVSVDAVEASRLITLNQADSVSASSVAASSVAMVVVSRPVDQVSVTSLSGFVESGGQLLVMLQPDEDLSRMQNFVGQICDTPDFKLSEAAINDYALWSRIDFRHPLFESFVDPKFNDFSKVRFWKYRKIEGLDETWQSVVNFDTGDVAIAERAIGKGRVVVLAAGWQPAESQLALSSKFVPLVERLTQRSLPKLDRQSLRCGVPDSMSVLVGKEVTRPDGKKIEVEQFADLRQIDTPGIYSVRPLSGGKGEDAAYELAVNLDSTESDADAFDREWLESVGVPTIDYIGPAGSTSSTAALPSNGSDAVDGGSLAESERRLQDRELESNQNIWRIVLLVTLTCLAIEILWSGLRGASQLSIRESSESLT